MHITNKIRYTFYTWILLVNFKIISNSVILGVKLTKIRSMWRLSISHFGQCIMTYDKCLSIRIE